MSYLNKKEYEALYERYLERSPDSLLDAAELKEGESILDFCGGSGRLAIAARNRGADKITIVDAEPAMCSSTELKNNKIDFCEEKINFFIQVCCAYYPKTVDVIFCQQAVNYWLNDKSAGEIHKLLNDGGRFVFNTFHYRPPRTPTFKNYRARDESVMAECYYTVGNIVHHFQMREGFEPHYTQFFWISPDEFMDWLSPTLDISVIQPNRNTDIYVCRKKK